MYLVYTAIKSYLEDSREGGEYNLVAADGLGRVEAAVDTHVDEDLVRSSGDSGVVRTIQDNEFHNCYDMYKVVFQQLN